MEFLMLGSTGPNVKLVQSLLIRLGYNPGSIDGIYGEKTRNAVVEFQQDSGLDADGIVGPKTWSAFDIFLRGYTMYTIKDGDTLYKIAPLFYTTAEDIITANPGIIPEDLKIGQRIIVPYGIDVVFTDIDYSYSVMERDIQGLKARYPFIQVGIMGRSVLGKNLYYLKLGNGPNKVHYNGAHHGLEWITTPLLMKFIENFAKAYAKGTNIRGFDVRDIWKKASIYIVPMVNPDGVDLVIDGLQRGNPYYDELLEWNDTGLPFSKVWQSNIRGVDLNRNYPASWQETKDQEEELGVDGPGPTRYGGPFPLSEPESEAMVGFARDRDFRLVIAYHSQGRVIYWKYKDKLPPNSFEIAQIFSRLSGYAVSDVPYEAAYAGFKDWFIEIFNKPGYTIEVGLGKNPLPIQQFETIYNNNEEILLVAPLL